MKRDSELMGQEATKKLNDEFGIPSQLTFTPGPGGLPFAEIVNSAGQAVLSLYGGQVIAFTSAGGSPVLWGSNHRYHEIGKAIRAGAPICWPWFGTHPTDATKPAHGFARTDMWSVLSTEYVDQDHTRIRLKLGDTPATRALWNRQFTLETVITVGFQLTVGLIIRNTGTQPFTYTGALHTYLTVSDVTKIAIHGLDGVSYFDLLDPPELKQQLGPITIGAETDRVYLDTSATCTIEDPGLERRITISKQGSKSTVIWNPWIDKAKRMNDFGDDEYMTMVCVEATNTHTDSITVDPNGEHHLQTTIDVKPL